MSLLKHLTLWIFLCLTAFVSSLCHAHRVGNGEDHEAGISYNCPSLYVRPDQYRLHTDSEGNVCEGPHSHGLSQEELRKKYPTAEFYGDNPSPPVANNNDVSDNTDTTDGSDDNDTTTNEETNTATGPVDATGTKGVKSASPETLQPAAPRVANLLSISGNAQRAKAGSLLSPLVVQINDQYGKPMSEVPVTFSASGGRLFETSTTTDADGRAQTRFILGSTPDTYRITARAIGTPFLQTFTAEATPRVLSHLEIQGQALRSVFVGRWLVKPLQVKVLDTDNDPVVGTQVTFSVISGSTDTARRLTETAWSGPTGLARANLIPSTTGTLLVEAMADGVSPVRWTLTASLPPSKLVKISGDDQEGTPGTTLKDAFVVEVLDEKGNPVSGAPVKFTITTGGGRLSATHATTDSEGRAETTLTLGGTQGINRVRVNVAGVAGVGFHAHIDPVVLVAAANRPVVYWIADGILYRLAGPKAEKIAEDVNGVVVSGGTMYWTAQTGRSSGTINRANLEGSGVTVLTSILSVPIGIAVDSVEGKLYWTNSRGRVQRAALDGSGIENVVEDLSDPRHIAFRNGYIYWTEGGDSIHRVKMNGQEVVEDVATDLEGVGGLAVGGEKLYWTEQMGKSSGTIMSANLDGTEFETLTSILSVPIGISLDAAGRKLYWTNARGRIQRSALNGAYIENVVEGLMAPSGVMIVGENRATGISMATVAGAAGAPTVVGRQLSAAEVERLEAELDLLLATPDRSPATMRRLVYLQQLLAAARPEQTRLLANYPNPFNPETWIPYELATDTEVRITIYNTQGVVIRTLHLGHQSAGYYTSRSRAAYWDGRNALGESVASGLYFYQLQADDRSQMRKMLIVK